MTDGLRGEQRGFPHQSKEGNMDRLFDLIDMICRLLPKTDDGYGDYDPLASV